MRRALALARAEHPHPNPRVGAVVVDSSGEVIATGAHSGPGSPHAETLALQVAGSRAEGATLVVTLEPCDHHGRTPPCTHAILAASIGRVVVGAGDPDRRVSGAGLARLEKGGIPVETGVLAAEIERADPGYYHHRRTGRPRVVLKAALTFDGQIGAIDGTSQWITGPLALEDAHRLRAESDAVMIGAGTLIVDDPILTVRAAGYQGQQPRPVLVAGVRRLPAFARIWERDPIVLSSVPIPGVDDLILAPGPGGRVDLDAGLAGLAERGILELLVEGGSGLAGSLWRAGLVDAGVWYLGARMAGGVGRGIFDLPFATIGDARAIQIGEVGRVGPDLRIEWHPVGGA